MKYRKLGSSELMVSPLTLGTMTFGGEEFCRRRCVYPLRGQYMITATPRTQSVLPTISGVSGRWPSTRHPQKSESTTKTPPYAA